MNTYDKWKVIKGKLSKKYHLLDTQHHSSSNFNFNGQYTNDFIHRLKKVEPPCPAQ